MSGLRGIIKNNNIDTKSLLKGNNINKSDAAKINKTLDAIEIIQKHPDVLNKIQTLPNGTRYTITPYDKYGGKTKKQKIQEIKKTKKNQKSKKQRKTRKH